MAKLKQVMAAALLLSVSTGVVAHAAPAPAGEAASATLEADHPGATYDRHVFTQFAEHLGHGIYGGLWVGTDLTIPNTRGFRNDVVGALRALKVPMVRWPGGCFADEYHWREGIGDPAKRPVKVNTNWGGVTEPNRVGTHEYMDLVEQIGSEAYISGNVGNGTPREMAEWVEYMTAPAGTLADERAANGHKAPWNVAYFGIGNELWGCGGNMRPEFAADETRRYSTFLKVPEGSHLLKVASGANVEDYNWTETMMKVAGNQVDGLSLHYYTVPASGRRVPPRPSSTRMAGRKRCSRPTVWTTSLPVTARSWTNTTPRSASSWRWMNGEPGSPRKRAPTPVSCISRTLCAMLWSPRSRSTCLPITPIACG
jgi:alpha-N-arabinofuranosidase